MSCTHQHLCRRTDVQVVVDLVGVSQCHFNVGVGLGSQVRYVIFLVLNAFLGKAQQAAGYHGSHVGPHVDAHMVVALEALEAETQYLQFHIGQ